MATPPESPVALSDGGAGPERKPKPLLAPLRLASSTSASRHPRFDETVTSPPEGRPAFPQRPAPPRRASTSAEKENWRRKTKSMDVPRRGTSEVLSAASPPFPPRRSFSFSRDRGRRDSDLERSPDTPYLQTARPPSPTAIERIRERTRTYREQSDGGALAGETVVPDEASELEVSEWGLPAHIGPGPPPIPYHLTHHHQGRFLMYFFFLIFCNIAAPCVVFYVLKNHTNLSLRSLIGFSSAALGVSSCFDAPLRLFKLVKYRGVYGPLGDDVWWHMDATMWFYTVALFTFAFPLAIAPAVSPVLTNFFLMSTPCLIGPFGVIFGVSLLRPRLPTFSLPKWTPYGLGGPGGIWLSSDPPGSRMKPAVYYFIEDVMAVDMRYGRGYREAIRRRWEASPPFQVMIRDLTAFWAFGVAVFCGATAAVVWTTSTSRIFNPEAGPPPPAGQPFKGNPRDTLEQNPNDLNFAFAWVLAQLFIWLIIWVLLSLAIMRFRRRKEREWWAAKERDGGGAEEGEATAGGTPEEKANGKELKPPPRPVQSPPSTGDSGSTRAA